MSLAAVKIAYKQLHNCLLNLPAPFVSPFINSTNLLVQNIVIKLEYTNTNDERRHIYCGWTGFFSSDSSSVEIDLSFARISQIKEGIEASIQLMTPDQIHRIQTAELEPATISDWELTEIYAGVIEDKFLNQIRALKTNQSVIIHPNSNSSSSTINFVVKEVHSSNEKIEYGLLTNNSELHIAPKVRSVHSRQVEIPAEELPSPNRCFILRSIAMPNQLIDIERKNDFCIFVNSDKLDGSSKFAMISVLEGPGTPRKASISPSNNHKNEKVNKSSKKPENVKIIAKVVKSTNIDSDIVATSELLSISLGLEGTVGEKLMIRLLGCDEHRLNDDVPYKLVIHPIITETPKRNVKKILKDSDRKRTKNNKHRKEFSIKYRKILASLFLLSSHVPLTNGMKLPIIQKSPFAEGAVLEIKYGSLDEKECPNWVLFDDTTANHMIEKGAPILKEKSFLQNRVTNRMEEQQTVMVARDEELNKASRWIKRQTNCILYGASGSGKTLLCKELCNRFHSEGYYTKIIDCNEIISTSNFDSIKKLLIETTIMEMLWYEPSVLVLENADSLIPKEAEHGESEFGTQITELFSDRLIHISKGRKIALVITCKGRDSINQIVFQKHLVEEGIHLKAPTNEQRFKLLTSFIKKYPNLVPKDKEFLRDVATETEGYLPFDLECLCDRAFHDAVSCEAPLQGKYFELANFVHSLRGFTPSSLRDVKLQKNTGTSWNDIGGLGKAKQILLETLEWPTKYAPIFANCPLRLRSGILLYGYPGCGKTLLASAVASQCGLNFISIKGPEILNKYIGASEQAVRELFERATTAKPCILFFDEFDSVAPKRGHDSTGVTDRIVNQLLTQMDGAEGLDGVYVLAATSRPDLIDPALLRPGRLDKAVLCEMPDYENRLDILKTILRSNKFSVGKDVDLAEIARKATKFSGADLQALIYNSYLKAVHEDLEKKEKSMIENNKDESAADYFVNSATKSGVVNSKINLGERLKNMRINKEKMESELKSDQLCTNLDMHQDLQNSAVKTDDPEERGKSKKMVLRAVHFKEGLLETNRSISNKQIKKLDQIYEKFTENRREGDLRDGEASHHIGGRSTLM